MITIIDIGGNTASIKNMLKRLKIDSTISNDKCDILNSSHLILPGVGTFDNAMEILWGKNIIQPILDFVYIHKKPILGICLGMQLMMYKSEEGTDYNGLGMIEGDVIKFRNSESIFKKTHMGWNTVTHNHDRLFQDMPEDERFYFVHSYHVRCDPNYVIAYTNYGYDFPSIIRDKNIIGVQFHPEKSHKYGMAILKNFSEI